MTQPDRVVRMHRRACDGFSRVAALVAVDQWTVPTPCREWDAAALVEHVIGFHDVLLLRPLSVRANRPRTDPAARWEATATTLFAALAVDGVLDRTTDLVGGGSSSPRRILPALTTDVLVHTWDLASAIGEPAELDVDLCRVSLAAIQTTGIPRDDMFGPELPIGADADAADALVAYYGRDPAWRAG